MPRPTKPIQQGSLTEPVAASRSRTWRKHAGPEHASQYDPDGTILVDSLTHETVAEVDLTDAAEPTVSIAPVEAVVETAPPVTYSWQSDRSIDGRMYHRHDELVPEVV